MNINLLPEKEIIKSLDKIDLAKKLLCGVLCSVALVVIVNLYFGFIIGHRQGKLTALEKEYHDYLELKESVKKLNQEIDSLDKMSALLEEFSPQQFYWSAKLLDLSEIIPEEIWLNKLQAEIKEDEEKLSLQGYLLPFRIEERPISVLNRFIKRIKEEDKFFKDFSDIFLVDVKAASLKNKEVLEFNIELILKSR